MIRTITRNERRIRYVANKRFMNRNNIMQCSRVRYQWWYVRIIPGRALHKKGLQRQIGVGTLVSSQDEERSRSRGSTAYQLRVNRWSSAGFVPPSVYIGFRLFVLPQRRPGQCVRFAGGQEGGLFASRIDPTASHPTQPRTPSPPRRAPPRPDRPVVCPGFGFDRSDYTFILLKTYRIQNLDIPRAGRDAAAHGGTAGRGGDMQDDTPTGPYAHKTTDTLTRHTIEQKLSWACLWKHEQRKPYVNRLRNKTSG